MVMEECLTVEAALFVAQDDLKDPVERIGEEVELRAEEEEKKGMSQVSHSRSSSSVVLLITHRSLFVLLKQLFSRTQPFQDLATWIC